MNNPNVAISGAVIDGEHRLQARVYYADTDFSGAVYHARYLEFFERGRSDFLRLADVHHTELAAGEDGGQFWVVREMQIRWTRAARIDDLLEIRTRIAGVKGARVHMAQQILRGETELASALVEAALIDASGRAQRLPASWRAHFEQLAAAQS